MQLLSSALIFLEETPIIKRSFELITSNKIIIWDYLQKGEPAGLRKRELLTLRLRQQNWPNAQTAVPQSNHTNYVPSVVIIATAE